MNGKNVLMPNKTSKSLSSSLDRKEKAITMDFLFAPKDTRPASGKVPS